MNETQISKAVLKSFAAAVLIILTYFLGRTHGLEDGLAACERAAKEWSK